MVYQHLDSRTKMTPAGKAALEEELNYLKSVRHVEIADWVKAAREGTHGDLADAAELAEAQREQGLLEARIGDLERILADAEVLAEPPQHGIVDLGSTVTVRDEEGVDSFTIVGPAEAAPKQGRVSLESPVGRGLFGKRAGETVEVETPAGPRSIEIVKVE